MTTFIALLCGINVGGNRKVPMADIAALVQTAGFTDVVTYIQSGNVVFAGAGSAGEVEATLERAVGRRFGFAVPTLVRTAAALRGVAAGNPFRDVAASEPSRLMLLLSKAEPAPGAAALLEARGAAGERVRAAAGAVWVHYPAGAGTSKLTPALVDRLVGSKVTARNWRTVEKLVELSGGGG